VLDALHRNFRLDAPHPMTSGQVSDLKAAVIVQVFRHDSQEEIAVFSSFWPYYTRHHGEWIVNDLIPEGRRIETPTCYIQFPREIIRPPRSLAEQLFNLRRWTVAKSGGHFPALEEPDILSESIIRFVAELRDGRDA
jgi:pimeloyl-ACP methyl ester carboxylesterase